MGKVSSSGVSQSSARAPLIKKKHKVESEPRVSGSKPGFRRNISLKL